MGMTFEEYTELASRTAKEDEYELINYTFGLIGEIGELIDLMKKNLFHHHVIDKDVFKKEAGDVLWYISQLSRLLDVKFSDAFHELKKNDALYEKASSEDVSFGIKNSGLILSEQVGIISKSVQEYTFENFDMKELGDNLGTVIRNLYFIIKVHGITIEEVAEANIEKLKLRYPNGFDASDSIKRVDTTLID